MLRLRNSLGFVGATTGNRQNILSANNIVVGMTMNSTNENLGVVLVNRSRLVDTSAGAAGKVGDSGNSHGRHVDGTVSTSEDQEIVEEATKGAANNRAHNGDPEVVAASRPNLRSVAKSVTGKTGTKVTCRVNGIASLPAKGSTETENKEEQSQRTKVASRKIVLIVNGVNAHHEDSRGDNLRENHTGASHKGGRVGAENTGSSGVTNNSSNSVTLVHVNGRLVVTVNNESTQESTQKLGKGVDGQLLPREATENTVAKSDSRIKMTTRNTTRTVNTKHNTNTPAPGNRLISTISIFGKNDLCDDTITKQDNHHSTKKLGKRLPQEVSHTGPEGQVAWTLRRVDIRVIAAHFFTCSFNPKTIDVILI